MGALELLISPYTPLALLLAFYILPYIRNATLRPIPGPFFAKFSNLWLLYQCRRGRRYAAVNDAHKRYGKVVRISPDHVSVLETDAVGVIYGHGSGFLKR